MRIVMLCHDHLVDGLPQRGDMSITEGSLKTADPSVVNHVGDRALLLVSLGIPRRYYLWESFTIERVVRQGDGYLVAGKGFRLNPPQRLEGPEFDRFCGECELLTDFQEISHLPYARHLDALASRYHRPGVIDHETRDFCDELCEALPDDPDTFVYRSQVLDQQGDSVGALSDLQTAGELFEDLTDSDADDRP